MTYILKTNRALLEFTFILVTITIIGPIVLIFIKNDYAKAYKTWFTATRKKVVEAYNKLSDDEKELFNKYLDKASDYTENQVISALSSTGINKDDLKELVSFGSRKIKSVIKKELSK